MNFREKLKYASELNTSLLTVGLDPDPARLPIDDVVKFCIDIVDATKDLVSCYKPNLAFFEQFGPNGWDMLLEVRRAIPEYIPVLADAKRGDIDNTSEAYARSIFEQLECDAITISPYLGVDSVRPFLSRPDKTAFILCRTSNPGAADMQELMVAAPEVAGKHGDGTPELIPLYQHVAWKSREWNSNDNVGLVVGATKPSELGEVRVICPDTPILVPGIGAQGGDLEASISAGLAGDHSLLLISSSRQILYASKGSDFAFAARLEAWNLRDKINKLRGVR
jgi:orotidine-5'-phosphate decarboxylase